MKKAKKIIIPILMAVVMGSPFVIKNIYSSIYNKLGTATSVNFSNTIHQGGSGAPFDLNDYGLGGWTDGQLSLEPNHAYELHINVKLGANGFLHAINIYLNSSNMNLSKLFVWSSTNMNVTYVNPSGDNIFINDFYIEHHDGYFGLWMASDAPWYNNDHSGIAPSAVIGSITDYNSTIKETNPIDLFNSSSTGRIYQAEQNHVIKDEDNGTYLASDNAKRNKEAFLNSTNGSGVQSIANNNYVCNYKDKKAGTPSTWNFSHFPLLNVGIAMGADADNDFHIFNPIGKYIKSFNEINVATVKNQNVNYSEQRFDPQTPALYSDHFWDNLNGVNSPVILSNNFNQKDYFLHLFNQYLYTKYLTNVNPNHGGMIIGKDKANTNITLNDENELALSELDNETTILPFTEHSVINYNYSESGLSIFNGIFGPIAAAGGFIPVAGPIFGIAGAISGALAQGYGNQTGDNPAANAATHYRSQGSFSYLNYILDILLAKNIMNNSPAKQDSKSGISYPSIPFKVVNYQISLNNWSSSMDWQNYYATKFFVNDSLGHGHIQLNFGNAQLNIKLDVEYGSY